MSGADVTVVGAGLIGTAIAWRLAQGGASVTVLDPAPGSGASGVAAGMLAPVSEVVPGEEQLLRLNLLAAQRWPTFAREVADASGMDPGYRTCGTVMVGVTREDLQRLDHLRDLQHRLGLTAERLLSRDIRRREPALAPGVAGGTWAPDDHQVDPRRLLPALLAAAITAGADLRHQAVTAVSIRDGRVQGVHTAEGTFAAATVVLAAGWATRDLPGLPAGATIPIRPVKGQILRLAGRDPRGADSPGVVVRAVVHGRQVYAVPRQDGEVVVGATVEERGPDTTVTAGGVHRLLDDILTVLPGLDEHQLAQVAAGLRPATPDGLPVIGPARVEGLYVAAGHSRHGVLLAPLTGDLVASHLLDGRLPPEAEGLGPQRFATTGVSA